MLRLKRIGINASPEFVAYLARDCAAYRVEGFKALSKIEVGTAAGHVLATLNIVNDPAILGPSEVGLGEAAFEKLGLAEGAEVTVAQAPPPASSEMLRAKIGGATLAEADYRAIIADVASHRYSKAELAAFLIACAGFMTTSEVLGLTRAMAAAGTMLDWGGGMVVDKHSIGGIPGNRTSMIVVPIVAAYGLTMPKTSSRAITSPAGTADTMEVLANVDLPVARMQEIVREVHGCLAWGGAVNLSPADDILIRVERPLGIDTPEQMVASILSKKIAAGVTHLVVDIPLGPTAKVRTEREAVRLRKLFEHIGAALGLELEVVFSDGAQPVGRGVGPVLEARDVMAVLRGETDGLEALRDKAVMLAGHVIEFDPALRGGEGHRIARELLDGGGALVAMERIIEAQGRQTRTYGLGPLKRDVTAPRAGRVTGIDNLRLARIARLAGAPMDKGAGLDMAVSLGTGVAAGDTLYTLYAHHPADFGFATAMAEATPGVDITPGARSVP